ncbi:hypothetical protein GS881_21545 [Rhodococcus hoagii]|nr:hypothetical protein [Prescottella equi]
MGLGLTALMMAVARNTFRTSICTCNRAVVGGLHSWVGVGYPLAGLLTDFAGIRAAYALGFAVANRLR